MASLATAGLLLSDAIATPRRASLRIGWYTAMNLISIGKVWACVKACSGSSWAEATMRLTSASNLLIRPNPATGIVDTALGVAGAVTFFSPVLSDSGKRDAGPLGYFASK